MFQIDKIIKAYKLKSIKQFFDRVNIMKTGNQNISLPKITHRFLQGLLNKSSKSSLPSQNIIRHTHNKQKQNIYLERSNRLTDVGSNIDNRQVSLPINQHFEVKSPFYQRIHFQNSDKCQCQLHRLKKIIRIPELRKKQHSYHNELVYQKVHQLKRYQQKIANNVKEGHVKIHEQISLNKLNYLSHSLQNTARIKEEKVQMNQKNKNQMKKRIEKTKSQNMLNKQLQKILFRQKLEKAYQLDDQNKPFQQILERRNIWQKDRKTWGAKIYKKIYIRLKQLKNKEQINHKADFGKQNADITQEEQNILGIEKCLALVLNNITSIDQILNVQEPKESQGKISQIFFKNLKLTNKQVGQRMCRKLAQIINQIVVQYVQGGKILQSGNQKGQQREHPLQGMSIKRAGQEAETNAEQKVKQSLVSAKDPNSFNRQKQSRLNNSSILSYETKGKPQNSQHRFRNSLFEMKSTSSKRLSKLSRHSFMSNGLGRSQDQPKKDFKIQQGKNQLQSQNISKFCNKRKAKGNIHSLTPHNQEKAIAKKSINRSPNITQSFLKQIISQKQQLNQNSEEQEVTSSDYQKQEAERMALIQKYNKALKQAKQDEHKQQVQRIDTIIQTIKKRILIRNAANFKIPQKYKQIKFQKFCSTKAFKYITAEIDDLKEHNKFKFLYSQLNIKKNIFQDDYIQDAIGQFSTMFPNEQQFKQWKQYLFENRSKIMSERLNGMIDVGIKQIGNNMIDSLFDIKGDNYGQTKVAQNKIFNKFDQNQTAYERYMQRLERKQLRERNSVVYKQKDLNISRKMNKQRAQRPFLQQVTQKTIQQNIQTISDEQILYNCIQNKSSLSKNIEPQTQQKSPQKGPELTQKQNKKKILKYMLKKKPQQFQMLNKDLNNFNKLINQTFRLQ